MCVGGGQGDDGDGWGVREVLVLVVVMVVSHSRWEDDEVLGEGNQR